MQARHRRLAPREPRRLPGLPQGRSPSAAVEGAADIGAVGVGLGGSTSAAVTGTTSFVFWVGGAAAAAFDDGVGGGATAVVAGVEGVTATASAVDTHDRAWAERCWM